jgi:hypothetical protein
VGLFDRMRAWFKGESTRRRSPSPSTAAASKVSTKEIEEFIASRTGVEAFLEPKTAIYNTTLLLVAADGEYLRRPIRDRNQAGKVCGDLDVPLYEAAKVGYPQRMKDYDRGIKRQTVDLDDLPPWPGEDPPDA